jgi:hypothetical protein
MQITGKIVHIDLSGGFWGIEEENGQKFYPVGGVPKPFQREGLPIRAKVRPAEDTFTIFMWGAGVELDSIEKI